MTPIMDKGSVNFDVHLETGLIDVQVRPPLGLKGAEIHVPVPIIDFLDLAAQLTLRIHGEQRKMMAQLARQATSERPL